MRANLDFYLCNPKNPNDEHVFRYLSAKPQRNPEGMLSIAEINFFILCAQARYIMNECRDEIEESFKAIFGEQGDEQPPFFILKNKQIYEYDITKKVYVNPLDASDFLSLDSKDSDTDASYNSDTASSESSAPFTVPSRTPSPVVDLAQNTNNDTVPRKNSGPGLFLQANPCPRPQPPVYMSFSDQRDIVYNALRFMLHDVKDIDTWLLSHVKNAANKDVLLWHIEHFMSNTTIQSVREALAEAREILLRPQPNLIERFQVQADHAKGLPSPEPKITARPVVQKPPPIVEQASFKILLINAVKWFLELIAEFLARIQSAPISPFCDYRFTC